ncbi:MAG: hypothetical protein E7773_13775 [Sphingomonas sp.]|uniref:hypothetical protein n=1 Tax=Sphingomonas sp. TaxID=28214 RepID=UPI001212F323|nr:hypothetical protein [Sphingomonas sp.]THD34731.1 MAG: hypothetical protein E7773_13775 [Sphingomonas sp.]
MSNPIFRRMLGASAAIAIAASLGACGRQATDSQMTAASSLPDLPATLPLDPRGSTAWPTAPEVAALPTAAPLRTVRVANPRDYYGYADAAYDYQDVLGDAPPDYYFDYDGVDPWAWEGYDQSVVFLEPLDQGYRYYYYRPGADAPYFVRDPDYGYGYDGDGLAVIYDRYGTVLPYADYGASRDYAARYYLRGRDMYAASHREDRRAVSAAAWAARQPTIVAARTTWSEARARQPLWSEFHTAAAPRQATYWREEAVRRQADTQRFDQWRAQAFRTPPPPRAIPAAWSNAKWARDDKRFQPARVERQAVAAAAPQAPVARDGRDRGNPAAMAAPDPRRAAIAPDQHGKGARFAAPMRQPQGGGNVPQAAPARVAQPRPDHGAGRRADVRSALRAQPDRAPRVERPQPQVRIERPQPPARVERPQPQAQAQGRGHGGGGEARQFRAPSAPRVEAPRPQPQAAPAPQPRGNGGGGAGRGNGGGNPGGGAGGKGGGGAGKHGHG